MSFLGWKQGSDYTDRNVQEEVKFRTVIPGNSLSKLSFTIYFF